MVDLVTGMNTDGMNTDGLTAISKGHVGTVAQKRPLRNF